MRDGGWISRKDDFSLTEHHLAVFDAVRERNQRKACSFKDMTGFRGSLPQQVDPVDAERKQRAAQLRIKGA
jgi:hypothetical protein